MVVFTWGCEGDLPQENSDVASYGDLEPEVPDDLSGDLDFEDGTVGLEGNGSSVFKASLTGSQQAQVSTTETQETPETPTTAKYIIRNASVKALVGNVEAATSNIESQVSRLGGYVSSAQLQKRKAGEDRQGFSADSIRIRTRYIMENTLAIRVPARQFEALMSGINGLAEHIDYSNVSAKDVGQEFVDLQARLKTKKEVEKRYIDLLRKKASNLEELLAAEEKIRVLREEIEAKEGRLRYLQNRIAYSTISLSLYEKETIVNSVVANDKYSAPKQAPGFLDDLAQALGRGWSLILGLIVALAHIWPLMLIGVGIWLFVRYQRLRKQAKA